MRINKLQLAGLAAVLAGVGANGAQADPLVINNATTTPVQTSDPNPPAPVEAGDVTINAGGSITVTTGQTAVTLNSNNIVSNAGGLLSNDANNSTGILVTGGVTGTINNTGSISLLENYTLTDSDNDGDFDGGFASVGSTGRYGIWVDAGGFNGNITSNQINIEGHNSAAIRIDGILDGNLTNTGGITVNGDNSHAFLIQGGLAGGIDGDLILGGAVNVNGTNSTGLTLNAPIINGGELSIDGSWAVTGYHSILRPLDVTDLDADDLLQSGSTIGVHFSVAGGITIEGIGVENDPDDDGDGVLDPNDNDDNTSASVRVYGEAPAIWIAADPSADIFLGPTDAPGGFGFHNRGAISAEGTYDGFDSTAIRIEGLGGSSVFTNNGIATDNSILSVAREADAYGIFIGQNANVPLILNRGTLAATSRSETDQTAYAIYLDTGANVGTIENTSLLRAQTFGELGDAVAIVDLSGTVTTINNSGEISAYLIATDDDLTDDVIPVTTGDRIAINVSAALAGVTINQTAPTVFTDDDAVDNDVNALRDVLIDGDILLGNFADTINLGEGRIFGDISFGNGADEFNITNGAFYQGIIDDSGGDLTLNITDGTLNLRGGQTGITEATFGADAILGVVLSDTPADSTHITASGQVEFLAGASIVPVVPVGLPDSDTIIFLTANGGFVGAANVLGAISGPGTSYLYNQEIVLATANDMALDFVLKTPAQLGMNSNQGTAFMPIIEALRGDSAAAAAFASLDNEFDFFDAYEDLMPSFASSAPELAATAIQQMQSATTNRLSATRLHDLDEVSVWAQEIAYGLNRTPATFQGQEFRGHGFGMAAGIDGPLDNGNLFGLSVSFITSEVEEPGRPEGEIAATFGQANAYYGTAMGPFDIDFVGGLGAGRMSSRRFVEIGDSFEALAEADWWSFEGHGAVRASLPMRLSNWMIISPQTALTYVAMSEQGYTEDGGGELNYDVDDAFSQRLWGDVGVEFAGRLAMRGQTVVSPRLYVGYRANLIDEEAERTFRFTSGGTDFTLVDEGLGDGGGLVGIGIDATNGYSTFTLGYEGEFGDQIERHSLNASIRFRF